MQSLLGDPRVAGQAAQRDPIHAQAQPHPPDEADTSGVHSARQGGGLQRLGRGELRSLVADFMAAHAGQTLSPAQVAAALDRSVGAVGNALGVLARQGTVQLVSSTPRRYRHPHPEADRGMAAEAPTGRTTTDTAPAATRSAHHHAAPGSTPAPSPHAAPHEPAAAAPTSAHGGASHPAGTAGDRSIQRAAALAAATRALAAFRAELAHVIENPTLPTYDPTTDACWLSAFLAICHEDPDAAAQALAQARERASTLPAPPQPDDTPAIVEP